MTDLQAPVLTATIPPKLRTLRQLNENGGIYRAGMENADELVNCKSLSQVKTEASHFQGNDHVSAIKKTRRTTSHW